METKSKSLFMKLTSEMFNDLLGIPTKKGMLHGCWMTSMSSNLELSANVIVETVTVEGSK